MLAPHELFKAQGFPSAYVFDRDDAGRLLPKSTQLRLVGNSVSPPVASALVSANFLIDTLRVLCLQPIERAKRKGAASV